MKHSPRLWLYSLSWNVVLASLLFVSLSGHLAFAQTSPVHLSCVKTALSCQIRCSDTKCKEIYPFRAKEGQISQYEEHTYRVLYGGQCYSDLTKCGFVDSGKAWKPPSWWKYSWWDHNSDQAIDPPIYPSEFAATQPKIEDLNLDKCYKNSLKEYKDALKTAVDIYPRFLLGPKHFSIYDRKDGFVRLLASISKDTCYQSYKGIKLSEMKDRLEQLTLTFQYCREDKINLSFLNTLLSKVELSLQLKIKKVVKKYCSSQNNALQQAAKYDFKYIYDNKIYQENTTKFNSEFICTLNHYMMDPGGLKGAALDGMYDSDKFRNALDDVCNKIRDKEINYEDAIFRNDQILEKFREDMPKILLYTFFSIYKLLSD